MMTAILIKLNDVHYNLFYEYMHSLFIVTVIILLLLFLVLVVVVVVIVIILLFVVGCQSMCWV